MGPELTGWRRKIDSLPHELAQREACIFLRLAKVLLGGKPAELVVIRSAEARCPHDMLPWWKINGVKLVNCWGFQAEELWEDASGNSARWLVYHPATLSAHLAQKEAIDLLNRLGLPCDQQKLIAEIRKRWYGKGTICHEVGILLGYPIKDVAGFMGLVDLPRTAHCGWCVYGSPEVSLALHKRFKDAEKKALAFLHGNSQEPSQQVA